MDTHTDITVLDNLMALNLDVNIWTARKKLTPADFGGADLPPEELASLGSKKICNPQELRIFGTLKARAVNLLDRTGVRFLGGWAIPEDKADDIVSELTVIRDDFLAAKEQFLNRYDEAVRDWISQHPGWESLIGSSTVSADYVRSRIGFKWQLFKLLPPTDDAVHQGLQDEVKDLGGTLFDEVAKAATDTWKRCFEGKDKVTHKALSPLRSIHSKLSGLSFVEPRVVPVVDLLDTTFNRVPARGYIHGSVLVLLQGVVSLLRDPVTLIAHGQKILDGQDAADILSGLVADTIPVVTGEIPLDTTDFVPEPVHEHQIDSHGLW
ncbi:conserved protein of unknown function [Pseudodesulfovibrio profundus]|uniref:DUF3150 domain-containing protein n=1 Tax=Pseudodesulfovibrio profundus TaxID=57320 RepID=A0A2C8F8I5_9BACT|nr:DUF3150 domain-containing protein [Pseudodesulfovibrio profundus]SOB58155.1 conserved protein of unknown function [Pseudodesulfovibrio profundus]